MNTENAYRRKSWWFREFWRANVYLMDLKEAEIR